MVALRNSINTHSIHDIQMANKQPHFCKTCKIYLSDAELQWHLKECLGPFEDC